MLAILKASATGPKTKTGKKVKAPKMTITPAVILVNKMVSVRNVPVVSGTACLRVILSASNNKAIIGI